MARSRPRSLSRSMVPPRPPSRRSRRLAARSRSWPRRAKRAKRPPDRPHRPAWPGGEARQAWTCGGYAPHRDHQSVGGRRELSMVSAAEQLAANLNFSALAKAEELKKRIWFTLGALLVYRFGTYIPLPGIDPSAWDQIFRSQAGGILGMFNMFSGGGIHRMAIFALNIMPYISASIIIQLLTTVSPQLEALKKEGEAGRKTLNQYPRYLTVLLAAFQSYGIAVGLEGAGNVVSDPGMFFRLSTAITLTGGTMFLMWLGEQIT